MEPYIPLLSAVFAGIFSAAAAIAVAAIQHRKTAALLEYRLGQLEDKVDKHNNLVERVYELEKDSAVIENEMKVANHRIADLEEKG